MSANDEFLGASRRHSLQILRRRMVQKAKPNKKIYSRKNKKSRDIDSSFVS